MFWRDNIDHLDKFFQKRLHPRSWASKVIASSTRRQHADSDSAEVLYVSWNTPSSLVWGFIIVFLLRVVDIVRVSPPLRETCPSPSECVFVCGSRAAMKYQQNQQKRLKWERVQWHYSTGHYQSRVATSPSFWTLVLRVRSLRQRTGSVFVFPSLCVLLLSPGILESEAATIPLSFKLCCLPHLLLWGDGPCFHLQCCVVVLLSILFLALFIVATLSSSFRVFYAWCCFPHFAFGVTRPFPSRFGRCCRFPLFWSVTAAEIKIVNDRTEREHARRQRWRSHDNDEDNHHHQKTPTSIWGHRHQPPPVTTNKKTRTAAHQQRAAEELPTPPRCSFHHLSLVVWECFLVSWRKQNQVNSKNYCKDMI